MINIEPCYLKIVQLILQKNCPAATVLVFGSRLEPAAKKYADLDLAIRDKKPLPPLVLSQIQEDFDESDIPFSVDVSDWYSLTPDFQQIILSKHVVLPK